MKETSLHLAAKGGFRRIIEYLLDNGANVNAENNLNQTPLDLATSYHRTDDIIRLLSPARQPFPTISIEITPPVDD